VGEHSVANIHSHRRIHVSVLEKKLLLIVEVKAEVLVLPVCIVIVQWKKHLNSSK
jgi:hypothetical protein